MAEIILEGVDKIFVTRGGDIAALRDINLGIDANEFVALVGASGCGKTTLLNLVAGFDRPTTGTISLDGTPITQPGPDRGVVFQQSALFPWLSVRENIGFGLSLRANRYLGNGDKKVADILHRVGLEAFAHQLPAQLSGGMRQRAAIAGVLVIEPRVLLMDEPFGALDALTRSIMQDFLLKIWEDNPKTVLLVTHDISEAIYLADRVVVMTAHPGRIREIVTVELPRPRGTAILSSPEFIHLRDHVTAIVREEAEKAATWGNADSLDRIAIEG